MRDQHSNSRSRELREVLALSPSLRLYVAGTSEEGSIPISHLGYQRLEEEESRVFDSRTHEITKLWKVPLVMRVGRKRELSPESKYDSLMDRDPETRSLEICRAKQSSKNLMESKRFSCSCWFMSVVSFLKV
jgi:hypothetical protein